MSQAPGYRVSNGPVSGFVRTEGGLGSTLHFRGTIFAQRFDDWVRIRAFRHFPVTAGHPVLGAPARAAPWHGVVDAYLTPEGVLEHQYPKVEYLLVGTLCRYGREVAAERWPDGKFFVKYDDEEGVTAHRDQESDNTERGPKKSTRSVAQASTIAALHPPA